jgi:hypothetical protein
MVEKHFTAYMLVRRDLAPEIAIEKLSMFQRLASPKRLESTYPFRNLFRLRRRC